MSGKPWFLKPIRIRSMAEFETFFGGAYKPLYEIEEAKESPIAADDYDFMALEPTSTSPVTPPIPHYYRLTAARSPITPALEDEAFARVGAEDEPLEPLDFELARFNLYNSMRLFYANGGGDCYVVSVGDYAKTVTAADLVLGLNAMEAQSGPTMLVIPDLVLLAPNDPDQPWVPPSGYAAVVQQMLAQCGRKQDRVALIDVYGANKVPAGPDYETYFEDFYAAVGSDFLSYGIAYFPFLYTSVVQPQEINYQNIAAGKSFTTLQTVLDWQAQLLYTGTRLTAVQETIKSMEAYDPETYDKKTVDTTNQNLTAVLPLLPQIETIILAENNVLPPSGAMAGVYTRVDAARGVWNAPANVSLNSVVQTTYQLTGDQQGDLNVP
ncbi:MAG TPA: hypothetical protein VHK90_15875, partial [Thermoanaerobaculia bacterium]|nr:hypothetical protein [Thermoanaerobaculia bacterium]